MKKTFKKLIAVTLTAVMTVGVLTGCAGGGKGGNGDDEGVASNGKTIYVYAQKNGLGEAWLENAAKAYRKTTGTEVVVEFDAFLSSNVSTVFENESAEVGDLYFLQSNEWGKYRYNDFIIDLTDFMNEKDESGKSLYDRQLYNERYIVDDDGNKKHCIVPFTAGVSGLAYNKEMMSYICQDVLGWEEDHEYPVNTKELEEVIDAVEKVTKEGTNKELFSYTQNGQSLDVEPFVWSGTTGALGGMMETWMNQWFGEEGMAEWYNQLENCDMLNDEGFYVIYQKIVDILRLEEDSNGNYVSATCIPNCISYNHTAAQSQLLLGKALMCPTGSWFYQEMEATIEDEKAWGFMPYPYLSDEEGNPLTREGVEMPKNEDGEYMNYARTNTSDYLCIPTRSQNQEEAKNFLRFMFSEEYMPTLQQDCQSLLVYEFDDTNVEKSEWLKEITAFASETKVMSVFTGSKMQAYGGISEYHNPNCAGTFSRLAQSAYGSSKVLIDSATGKKISSAGAATGTAVTENVYNYVHENYLNCVEDWGETVRRITRY